MSDYEICQTAISNPALLALNTGTTTIAHYAAQYLDDERFISFVGQLPKEALINASKTKDSHQMPMSHLVAKHRFYGGFFALVRQFGGDDIRWWQEQLLVEDPDGRSLLHLVAKHQPVEVICEMFKKLDVDVLAEACVNLKRVYFERVIVDLVSIIKNNPQIDRDGNLSCKLHACVDRRRQKRSWTRSREFQQKLIVWDRDLTTKISIFRSSVAHDSGNSSSQNLPNPFSPSREEMPFVKK